jgi:hypothetical protein
MRTTWVLWTAAIRDGPYPQDVTALGLLLRFFYDRYRYTNTMMLLVRTENSHVYHTVNQCTLKCIGWSSFGPIVLFQELTVADQPLYDSLCSS